MSKPTIKSVPHVSLAGRPFEVGGAIVALLSIFVVYLGRPLGSRDKGISNKTVNEFQFADAATTKVHADVFLESSSMRNRGNEPSSQRAATAENYPILNAHSPKSGHFIVTTKTRYSSPNFIIAHSQVITQRAEECNG